MEANVSWHLPDDQLRRYASGAAEPPLRWSVEAHLTTCPTCRERLTAHVAPSSVAAGWDRLETELDAPTPGWVERLLTRAGVPQHSARLLAATPALRWSWLAALASTVALTALLANVAAPVVFLTVAPLLPLLGVAVSYGPRVDPTYEITVVAPVHKLRLLLLRCAAVLVATTATSALASLALPQYGLAALGWFLPALALTLLTLAMTPRLGADAAAAAVGAGWLALVLCTLNSTAAGSAVFAPAGQLAAVLGGALAAAALTRMRPAFDTTRMIDRARHSGPGGMS
jgi:hypothetical protein